MLNSFLMFSSLFAAIVVFLIGNGLLNTLVSTRLSMESYASTTAGIVLSSYYMGLLAGSFICHHLIQRIGHIRSFAVFGAITTATALLYALYLSPWFWIFLRFSSGITSFGLFMVIESWLNECSEQKVRGQVFSIYMILSYTGIAIGQQLLNLGDVQGQGLFIVAGIVFSLSLVPVSVTRGIHPQLPDTTSYRFMAIFRKSPLGMLGCLAAGLTNSTFYTLTPVFCMKIGLSLHQLSLIMSLTIFCGLAAQWLVGALSDRFDRTMVLAVVALSIAGVCGLMWVDGSSSFEKLLVGMGLFGMLAFAIYPISVARAHDVYGGQDVVAVSAGLLFAYSIGACASPLLASGVMFVLGSPFGLFAFWSFVSGILAVLTLYLRKQEKVAVIPVEDQVVFIPMKKTSPVIMALKPIIEENTGTDSVSKNEG